MKLTLIKFTRMIRVLLLLGVLSLCAPARAWWPEGHGILSKAAVRALPDELPKFFRKSETAVAHHSFDPDVAKNKSAPHATNAEYSEHFIDWELIAPVLQKQPLSNQTLPPTRYEYLKLCYANGIEPDKAGLLPYAVAEWTERLAIAFAEHRRWPQNKRIREKCLLNAGILAHYAQDLCQPLHVTIDYDGRALPDGSSPKTGIHAKVDALVETLALSPKPALSSKPVLSPQQLARDQNLAALPDLLAGIVKEIADSRAHIETIYALEAKLPPVAQKSSPVKPATMDAGVLAFTNQRVRAATRFTASLFLTAWRQSANIALPDWLRREEK